MESIEISILLPAEPERIFNDWLDSTAHSAFTGSPAQINPLPGGRFTAWDGYIYGTTLEIESAWRIVQAWRTTEFSQEQPDSRLEVLLEPVETGTRLTLRHSGFMNPSEANSYRQGWIDFYFTPMQRYYGS